MSESQAITTNMENTVPTNVSVNVFIDGDKSGFNSKNAVDKFKQAVKTLNYNIDDLTKKFVKSGYVVEEVERTGNNIKFMIDKVNQESKKTQEPKTLSESEQRRQLLKAKINLMRQDRTNSVYHKAKTNSNVPSEVLSEYMKLKKISKMPIPEPNEIFARPEEYKPVISMLLQNNMMKQLPATHPYVRYFKLIAEKIGLDMALPIPTQDFTGMNNVRDLSSLESLKGLMENSGPVTDIKGNEISKGDETDSEEEDNIEV